MEAVNALGAWWGWRWGVWVGGFGEWKRFLWGVGVVLKVFGFGFVFVCVVFVCLVSVLRLVLQHTLPFLFCWMFFLVGGRFALVLLGCVFAFGLLGAFGVVSGEVGGGSGGNGSRSLLGSSAVPFSATSALEMWAAKRKEVLGKWQGFAAGSGSDSTSGPLWLRPFFALPTLPGASPPAMGHMMCMAEGQPRAWIFHPFVKRHKGRAWPMLDVMAKAGDGQLMRNNTGVYELDGGEHGRTLREDIARWRRGEVEKPAQVIVRLRGPGGLEGVPDGKWRERPNSRERCDPVVLHKDAPRKWGRGCRKLIVNGLYASGSTLIFNVLRALRTLSNHQSYFDTMRYGSGYKDAVTCPNFPGSREIDNTLEEITKIHLPTMCGRDNNCPCTVVTFRDFRDSLCSHAKRKGNCMDCEGGSPRMDSAGKKLYASMYNDQKWHLELDKFLSKKTLLLRYEDFNGPCLPTAIARLADVLGVPVTAEEIDGIVQAVDERAKLAMKELAKKVKSGAMKVTDKGMAEFGAYDQYSQIHANHGANNGATGVWKQCFSQQYQQEISRPDRLGAQLDRWGYEVQNPSKTPLPGQTPGPEEPQVDTHAPLPATTKFAAATLSELIDSGFELVAKVRDPRNPAAAFFTFLGNEVPMPKYEDLWRIA